MQYVVVEVSFLLVIKSYALIYLIIDKNIYIAFSVMKVLFGSIPHQYIFPSDRFYIESDLFTSFIRKLIECNIFQRIG